MTGVASALVLGFGFGWALHKAGLTRYDRIVNIYRLRDLTVLRFMLTALAVAAVAIEVGRALGWAGHLHVPPTAAVANLVGGVVFGLGMATAGYCPGTIVAEAGEGRLDAWLAGGAGLVVGALTFGLLQPTIMPVLRGATPTGRGTVADLLGASPWLVAVVFALAVALVLVLVRRVGRPSEPARTR